MFILDYYLFWMRQIADIFFNISLFYFMSFVVSFVFYLYVHFFQPYNPFIVWLSEVKIWWLTLSLILLALSLFIFTVFDCESES